MKRAIFVTAAPLLAALVGACAEPPVKPIPDTVRRSVTAVSTDLSGMKDSDTSKLGARGSEEGSRLGALQGAATIARGTYSLLGLALIPVGAAAGSAKGAIEAQSAQVVDQTRNSLRIAIQETDFAEMLRQRLATTRAGGSIDFSTVVISSGATTAPATTASGVPVGHVISLEYRLNVYGEHLVNPQIGVHVRATAQVLSPDRKQLLHSATWSYCGDRFDFVQMADNNAAAFRRQIEIAASVLAEAIPYDLYVSNQPRRITVRGACMDFSDLPSRTGRLPVAAGSPTPVPPIPLQPTATTPAATPAVATAPATPVQVASAASVARSPAAFDGNWQIQMEQLSTTYGTTVGGECPTRYSAGATFVSGNAEWPRGKLALTGDGELSGWMNVPAVGTSMLPFIVNLAGNMDNAAAKVVKGTVSGRCTGSFTMRKQ